MTFVDTNVIIDILSSDDIWGPWSIERLSDARCNGPAIVNIVVLAELSRNYRSLNDLQSDIAALGLVSEPVDDVAAFIAGQRFIAYREARKEDRAYRVLPDFFVGAHAFTRQMPLLTRDLTLYRRYFPELTLITPETDPA
ncbi:putative nucleic acid-binding protein [Sphingobium xenophagum]|uniref:Nucleic acid-binding protein n=1 Tax=Sphingobium xenophagum TaxID=121428 RepID=A0ABU1X1C4_SPHXE|nr:type II toxin-antitoxin system VapC family toxin [Sphingobium xenophagum]MDR7155393.1 putative nucleic acid-binding protein [Sphingobium xenophagum]